MGFNTIDLNNINLDYDNFNKDDPESVKHVRLGLINLNNAKHVKKK